MLEELFATPITCRMIEYVIMNDHKEFNYKDVADALEVSNPSVYTAFKACKQFGLIHQTRRIGSSKLYQTTTTSPIYLVLKKLIMEVSVQKHYVEMKDDGG